MPFSIDSVIEIAENLIFALKSFILFHVTKFVLITQAQYISMHANIHASYIDFTYHIIMYEMNIQNVTA